MNMQKLMMEAQKMQAKLQKEQAELENSTYEGTSSLVTVVINGKKEVLKVTIKADEDFDLSDMEMLEEMVQVAINDALKQVDKITEKKMGKYTSAMPGLF